MLPEGRFNLDYRSYQEGDSLAWYATCVPVSEETPCILNACDLHKIVEFYCKFRHLTEILDWVVSYDESLTLEIREYSWREQQIFFKGLRHKAKDLNDSELKILYNNALVEGYFLCEADHEGFIDNEQQLRKKIKEAYSFGVGEGKK